MRPLHPKLAAIVPSLEERPEHRHKEAFCLMWYACRCGHREQFWNSRDGVTPFGLQCPSCGSLDFHHVDFFRDRYAPNHAPHPGQRVWVDMSLARAESIAKQRIQMAKDRGITDYGISLEELTESIYHGGLQPDVRVHGYERSGS